MRWADRAIRWVAKYGTSSLAILVALAVLIVLLIFSQTLGVLSIESVFRVTVVAALLEILLLQIALREQKHIGVDLIEELPSLIQVTRQAGVAKVYCLANTLTRSESILKDLVEKCSVQVHAICSNPSNVTVAKHKQEIIQNARELLVRLHPTGRFHLYLTTNRPTVPGWVLVDAFGSPVFAMVGWYTYCNGDTEMHSDRNPKLWLNPRGSSFARQLAVWALKEFKRHEIEGSAKEISGIRDIEC